MNVNASKMKVAVLYDTWEEEPEPPALPEKPARLHRPLLWASIALAALVPVAVIGALATWIPSRRVMNINPAVVLRNT